MFNFRKLFSMNLFDLLQTCSDKISSFAEANSIREWILFGVILVAAVLIGVFAFKLTRILLAVGAAGGGYILATQLLFFIEQKVDTPEWAVYVLGAILAVVMAVLAFQKYHYAFFTAAAGVVFCMSFYYLGNRLVLAAGLALLVAFIAVYFVRGCIILGSSLAASAVAVTCVAAFLPEVEWLQVNPKNWGFIGITLALAVIFAIVQFVTNRHYSL